MDGEPRTQIPVESTPPVIARRFGRPAIGVILALLALVLVAGAVLVTTPKPPNHLPEPPRDAKAASPAFLNQPPRRAAPSQPPPDPDALLFEASRSRPSATQRTPALPPQPPPMPGDSAAAPEGPPLSAGEAPEGAYRPFPTYAPPSTRAFKGLDASGETPAWKAGFASPLVPSNTVTQGLQPRDPAPPRFEPPPQPESTPIRATVQPRLPTQPGGPAAIAKPSARTLPARTLRAGTILNLILLTSVSTQIRGDAVAHLAVDAYGVDGSLLLPKGTRFIGSYESRVALGEHRLALAWTRLEPPGGPSYSLPGLPATSPDGAAGAPGKVNNHTGLVFGRAALLSLLSAGAQLGQPRQSRVGATLSNGEVVAGSVSAQLSQAATDFLQRAVDVTPTIFIPAGSPVEALLPADLELPLR